jgi:hypothetical protein
MTERLSTFRHLRRSTWLLSAVIVVLVGGLALTAMSSFASPARRTLTTLSGSDHGGIAKATRAELIVHGSSPAFLAPGVTKKVTIRIRNPHHTLMVINTASIKVGDASEACKARKNISTTRYDSAAPGAKRYVVYLHHKVRIPLTLTMLNLPTNQDACKGVRFPLTYAATAQEALS